MTYKASDKVTPYDWWFDRNIPQAQARKNVGASTCWKGYKAKGTKMKGGKKVPNCVKEFSEWRKIAEKK